jgi:copper chaperone CopZ
MERQGLMDKVSFDVGKELCEECSLALRRFIGRMEGVESVDVEDGKIAVAFESTKVTEEELNRITRDSIEKLRYKIKE